MIIRKYIALITCLLVGSIHLSYAAQRVYVPATKQDIYGTPQVYQGCYVGFQDGNGGDVCYLLRMIKTSNTYSRLTQQKVTLLHGTLVDTLYSGSHHRIARNWQYDNSFNLTCLQPLPGNGGSQERQWSWGPGYDNSIAYYPFNDAGLYVAYVNTDSLGHYEIYNNTMSGWKYITFYNKSVEVRSGETPTGKYNYVNQFAEHIPIETLNKNFSALTIFVPGWLYTDTFRLGEHGTWANGVAGDSLVFASTSLSFPVPVAESGYEFAGWRSTATGTTYQPTDQVAPGKDEVFEAVFTNGTTPLPQPLPILSDTIHYAEGKEFYFAFLKNAGDILNVSGEGEINCYARVLSRQPAHITLTAPDGTAQSYDIPANQYWEPDHLQRWQDNAYHLESSTPVIVEASNHKNLSQDVFSVSSVASLGTSYVVQAIKSSVAEIAVIATEDNTNLSVTMGKETKSYVIRKGSLSLNKGQVCYLQSMATDYSDLGKGTTYGSFSGTRIEANHPIAVIEGCAATPYVGYPLNYEYGASDHQCTQAYSEEWMGTEFIVMGDVTRGTNFAEFSTLTANTQIITPSQTITIQPGEVFQMPVQYRQVTYVQASNPITCVLFHCGMPNHDGDPSQTTIYPISHASNYSQFTCNRISPRPSSITSTEVAMDPMHVLHLTCPTNQLTSMHFDGIPLEGWKPVPNKTDWSYLIAEIPTDSMVVHHLANPKGIFTGYISALSITESYSSLLPKMHYLQVADTTCDSICHGEHFEWKGKSYTQTGIYTISNKTDFGIDSASVLKLFVSEAPITLPIKDTASCQMVPFIWRGHTIVGDTTCYDTIRTTKLGCDSIYASLRFVVKEPSSSDTTAYICHKDLPFIWHGKEAVDGDTIMRKNVVGCDSIVTLRLFVSEAPVTIPLKDTASCQIVPFQWRGHTIVGDTICYDTIRTTKLGCDSIYASLRFVVKEPSANDTTAYTCYGIPFIWHGKVAQDGDTIVRKNAQGCDSVVTLKLYTSKAPASQSFDTIVCDTLMPYTWRGRLYDEPAIYRDTLYGSRGCDSVYRSFMLDTIHCVRPEPPVPPEPECGDSLVYRKWDDVLFCDDGLRQFIAYQWYRNEKEITGETKQYLYLPNGQMGDASYGVVATRRDGTMFISCSKPFYNWPRSADTYVQVQTVVRRGNSLHIKMSDEWAEIELYSMIGQQVMKTTIVGSSYALPISLPTGTYVLRLKSEQVNTITKIMVE